MPGPRLFRVQGRSSHCRPPQDWFSLVWAPILTRHSFVDSQALEKGEQGVFGAKPPLFTVDRFRLCERLFFES
jgi:hypothetical protein